MLLWAIMALLTACVVALLIRPLAGRSPDAATRSQYDLTLYRAQLDELARDVENGVTAPADAAAARLEIERRMLAAATGRQAEGEMPARKQGWAAIAVLVLIPAIAVPIYVLLGTPDEPDAPLAARGAETRLLAADGKLDLEKARTAIEAKLKADPKSAEGWLLLGKLDAALQRWPDARAALDQAMSLSDRSVPALEAYGKLLMAQADGTVTPEAATLFQEAVAKQPKTVEARYDLALAKAQQGDMAGAQAAWEALASDAPPEAPWLGTVRAAIEQAKRKQGAPAGEPAPQPQAGGPPPEAASIMQLPPEQRGNAIRGMVAGLAARLQAHPDDFDGWMRLGRSERVLGDSKTAADAYAKAAALKPQDPAPALAHAEALRDIGGDTPLTAETVAAFRTVATLMPDDPETLWVLGLAAKQAGKPAEASQLWQRLLAQLKPDAPETAELRKALAALPPA